LKKRVQIIRIGIAVIAYQVADVGVILFTRKFEPNTIVRR